MYCKRNIFELSVLLCVFALVLTVATTVDRQLRKLHHPTNYAIDANRLVGQDLAHCTHYLGSVVEDNSFYEGGFHYYTHNSSHLKKAVSLKSFFQMRRISKIKCRLLSFASYTVKTSV